MKKLFSVLLAAAVLLSGCAFREGETEIPSFSETTAPAEPETLSTAPTEAITPADRTELFSDRDFKTDYDADACVHITLSGNTALCDSDAVKISGSTVTITDEGTYVLSGTLEDGTVIVEADKQDKTQLVLAGASIHSGSSAALYIRQADKVFVTLEEETENSLSNGGSFEAIDGNNIDAALFSKEDLTLNGTGSLTVTSPAGHGVVSKDDLVITGGSISVTAASHGLTAKDALNIAGGSFTLISGKDGIHAENADETSLGSVYIENGEFQIEAEGDGISAGASLQVENGSFSILTGGGSVNAQKQTSDHWGGFMGGGPGGRGGRGSPMGSIESETTSEDSTSIKGLKAGGTLTVNGGSFSVDSADDAFHSNADVTVNGGTFDIATGDDGFHADETLTVTAGTVRITESYEGLEGLHIRLSGGDITLAASDDGLNAAGGTDSSGMGGFRGGDRFGGMGGTSDGTIEISGGTLSVNASGDGIDANGSVTITGGFTVVSGPTAGDTATLDYDLTAEISGGTFIGTGASGMAQTFSELPQGVFAVRVGNMPAGTEITLTDGEGNTVLTHTPELDFAVVILSCPEIQKGVTYTVTVGTVSGEAEAY